jgi:hypothetical protein
MYMQPRPRQKRAEEEHMNSMIDALIGLSLASLVVIGSFAIFATIAGVIALVGRSVFKVVKRAWC